MPFAHAHIFLRTFLLFVLLLHFHVSPGLLFTPLKFYLPAPEQAAICLVLLGKETGRSGFYLWSRTD